MTESISNQRVLGGFDVCIKSDGAISIDPVTPPAWGYPTRWHAIQAYASEQRMKADALITEARNQNEHAEAAERLTPKYATFGKTKLRIVPITQHASGITPREPRCCPLPVEAGCTSGKNVCAGLGAFHPKEGVVHCAAPLYEGELNTP